MVRCAMVAAVLAVFSVSAAIAQRQEEPDVPKSILSELQPGDWFHFSVRSEGVAINVITATRAKFPRLREEGVRVYQVTEVHKDYFNASDGKSVLSVPQSSILYIEKPAPPAPGEDANQ